MWPVNGLQTYKHISLYAAGGQVSMVDYYCWPWVERVPVLNTFFQVDIINKQRCPKLQAWVSAMEETPGVRATRLSTEEHLVLYEKYRPSATNVQTIGHFVKAKEL